MAGKRKKVVQKRVRLLVEIDHDLKHQLHLVCALLRMSLAEAIRGEVKKFVDRHEKKIRDYTKHIPA